MNRKFRFPYDCSNIEWENVVEILKTVGMANYDRDIHKKALKIAIELYSSLMKRS